MTNARIRIDLLRNISKNRWNAIHAFLSERMSVTFANDRMFIARGYCFESHTSFIARLERFNIYADITIEPILNINQRAN